MEDDLEDLRRRAGLTEAMMTNDQIAQALFQSVAQIQHLADLAYGASQTEGLPLGSRRAFERIGIRATDLVHEVAAFAKQQT